MMLILMDREIMQPILQKFNKFLQVKYKKLGLWEWDPILPSPPPSTIIMPQLMIFFFVKLQ